MRAILVIALTSLVGLQGCVIPAAMDAMKRRTSYEVVKARQIDATQFRVLIKIEHLRGVFDPLGGHGSGLKTQSIDIEIWRLVITDSGILTKKEDTLTFKSESEIANWYARNGVEIDMDHGRITMSQAIESTSDTRVIKSGNLRILPDRQIVQGSVNGRECTVPLPPSSNASREFLTSDSGEHLMIIDQVGEIRDAVVIDVCNANTLKRVVQFPLRMIQGFSVSPDGSPIIRGSSVAFLGKCQTYAVQKYPGPERLTFDGNDLGLNEECRRVSRDFMFDEKARRFHWIVNPKVFESRFSFITHDFLSGKTVKQDFSPESQ